MQQYFIDEKININEPVFLREDILYHLKTVLRGTNQTFRICDNKQDIYECKLEGNFASPIRLLDENNELKINITAIISLIKSDKFELTLQKLTELGVTKIVPYNASRSVVKENKPEKKNERYKKIITEAAEQCHRNRIPEITNAIDIDDIPKYMSDINLIPYEKETEIKNEIITNKNVTFIIGPEGGFKEKEYLKICNFGFKSISLGKRILRAETAALYITSIIAEKNQ